METVRNGPRIAAFPKAQVAMEYLIVVSFAIMVIIPYVLYLQDVSTSFKQGNSMDVASNSVQELGQTADWVYSQGVPSKLKMSLTIPDGVKSISFRNHTMTWKVQSGAGLSDVYYNSVAPLNGSLPVAPGYYSVIVSAIPSGVNITISTS